ncbi:hypothetical protein CSR02_01285 [Acetobacter pomorum]|uniref:Uncharacterized protein n=1 Tax=Acetobacter pomorum TaxID=65959 RepID=A0A2G4RFR8_9PROT|nr:hypothetical protein CSR02_01285 [Acetobacter pomorum]
MAFHALQRPQSGKSGQIMKMQLIIVRRSLNLAHRLHQCLLSMTLALCQFRLSLEASERL